MHAVSRWSRWPGCCGFRGVLWVRQDFRVFCKFFFLRTHTACCKYEAALPHLPLYKNRGACRVPLFNESMCPSACLCVCQRVRNIGRVTDCENCTRPISPNPGSMEAGEYGLTRGTCFLACRLELLWISWCVLGGADFSSVLF